MIAVELPSQFMEHWCWENDALNLMTAHIDTQAPLPQDLLDSLLAAKNFQSGLQTLRQLEFSLFDMAIHSQAPLKIDDIQAEIDRVRQAVSVMPSPSRIFFTTSQTSFCTALVLKTAALSLR